jgi:hypothetical protein
MISADSPCRGREGTPLFSSGKSTAFFVSSRKMFRILFVLKTLCNFAAIMMIYGQIGVHIAFHPFRFSC